MIYICIVIFWYNVFPHTHLENYLETPHYNSMFYVYNINICILFCEGEWHYYNIIKCMFIVYIYSYTWNYLIMSCSQIYKYKTTYTHFTHYKLMHYIVKNIFFLFKDNYTYYIFLILNYLYVLQFAIHIHIYYIISNNYNIRISNNHIS